MFFKVLTKRKSGKCEEFRSLPWSDHVFWGVGIGLSLWVTIVSLGLNRFGRGCGGSFGNDIVWARQWILSEWKDKNITNEW